jgi:transposase InsO family protein
VDPVSACVPGWAVGPSPNRELALTAWQRVQESFRAVDRPLAGVVVHQDQDAVFTSYDWLEALLIDADVVVSYSENGAKGNPLDRVLLGPIQGGERLPDRGTAETIPELRDVLGDQMVYYNRERRHSGIDYRSPIEFLRAEGRPPGILSRN